MSELAEDTGLNKKGLIGEKTKNLNVGGHRELIPEGENAFGGKNPLGNYVPMSEDEQEVLHRLDETDDLHLVVGDWGTITNPKLTIGDHRLRIDFAVVFRGLHVAQRIHFLDLELKLGNGMTIIKDRQSTMIGNEPLEIYEGFRLPLQWDVAIHSMDPDFVRMIKPGATGLTSRRQDRDTREMTEQGNMQLDPGRQALLRKIGQGQSAVRSVNEGEAIRASLAAGEKLVGTADGVAYKHSSGR